MAKYIATKNFQYAEEGIRLKSVEKGDEIKESPHVLDCLAKKRYVKKVIEPSSQPAPQIIPPSSEAEE